MSFSTKQAEQIFVGQTIVRVEKQNGSLSLFTKDNQEIHISPGSRGVTEYEGDSICFWSKSTAKKK